MNNINFIIIGMFLIDIILTYVNVNKYKKLFPKKDYTNIELNPIVKYLWKQMGLLKGGILATLIQIIILIFIISSFDSSTLLILLGAYLVIILIHLDNFNLINQKKKGKKKVEKEKWRKYAVIIILILGIVDLLLTFYYVSSYHTWQPDKTFEEMETNPLLLLLWNNLGLSIGMFIGMLIILPLQYFIAKKLYWMIVLVLFLALAFALWNNLNNINMLHELIKLYPSGSI